MSRLLPLIALLALCSCAPRERHANTITDPTPTPRVVDPQEAPASKPTRLAADDPNLSPQPGPDTRYWQRYMADTVGATSGEFRRAYGRPNWEERTRNDQGGATETWYYTRADGQVRVVVDGDSDRVLSATALPPYSTP